jgi:hypothetical protein
VQFLHVVEVLVADILDVSMKNVSSSTTKVGGVCERTWNVLAADTAVVVLAFTALAE